MATDYSEHPAICDAVQEVADKHFDDLHFTEDDIADATRIIAAAVSKVLDPIRNALEGCGGCDYSESDGGLFRHCDSCLEQIARTAWELCTAPNPDEASQ